MIKRVLDSKRPKQKERKLRPTLQSFHAADWDRADAEQLKATIAAMGQYGGALRLGLTRDGGAYAVGIYGDGNDPYTLFVRPDEDLNEFLREIEQTFRLPVRDQVEPQE